MPYLQLHEFESLLFSSPVSIAAPFEDEKTGQYRQLVKALENIRNRFKTPEEINNRPETCPHRQIENLEALGELETAGNGGQHVTHPIKPT